jgi:hypothetical protein
VDEGRMAHSCKLSRVIGNADGRTRGVELTTALKASRNEVDEQAQKSNAFSCGRSHKRARMTFSSRSSSICS